MHIKQYFLLVPALTMLGLAIQTSACKKDAAHGEASNQSYMDRTDCSGFTPTYTANVRPIFDTRCATSGCHDNATSQHDLSLEGYANAKGHFNDHELLCSINQDGDCPKMPETGTNFRTPTSGRSLAGRRTDL